MLGAVLVLIMVGCTPPGPAALLDGEELLNEGEYQAAIRRLKEATELLGDHPEAWNFLGLAYHRAGQAEDAVKAYQRALTLNVDHLSARYNLGCLLLENRDYAAAEQQFKSYDVLAGDDPKVKVKIGSSQLGAGRLQEAQASFESALRSDRGFAEAWNGLGLIKQEQQLHLDADRYFEAAIEQDVDYAPAYLNQAALAHRHLNDLPRALLKYRRYLFLAPNSPAADHVKVLTSEIEEALRPKAEPIVQEDPPTETDPTEEEVAMTEEEETKGPAESTSDPGSEEKEAEEVAKAEESAEVVAANQDSPEDDPATKTEAPEEEEAVVTNTQEVVAEGSISVAESESSNNGKEEEVEPPLPTEIVRAERTFEPPKVDPKNEARFEVVESDVPQPVYEFTIPDDPQGTSPQVDTTEQGWRTVSNRRTGMGISVGRKMFQPSEGPRSQPTTQAKTGSVQRQAGVRYQFRNPGRPVPGNRRTADPFFQRGNEAYRRSRASEAVLAYREAVSRDPAFFAAYYNMGLAAIRAGLTETALEAYEYALAIDPAHRNARYNFALALEQGRHHREAATELDYVLRGHPDDVNAHFTLANLYAKKLGDATRAKYHYEQVLSLNPNHPSAVSIRYWLSAGE